MRRAGRGGREERRCRAQGTSATLPRRAAGPERPAAPGRGRRCRGRCRSPCPAAPGRGCRRRLGSRCRLGLRRRRLPRDGAVRRGRRRAGGAGRPRPRPLPRGAASGPGPAETAASGKEEPGGPAGEQRPALPQPPGGARCGPRGLGEAGGGRGKSRRRGARPGARGQSAPVGPAAGTAAGPGRPRARGSPAASRAAEPRERPAPHRRPLREACAGTQPRWLQKW